MSNIQLDPQAGCSEDRVFVIKNGIGMEVKFKPKSKTGYPESSEFRKNGGDVDMRVVDVYDPKTGRDAPSDFKLTNSDKSEIAELIFGLIY